MLKTMNDKMKKILGTKPGKTAIAVVVTPPLLAVCVSVALFILIASAQEEYYC
jgi:hypothetical protein